MNIAERSDVGLDTLEPSQDMIFSIPCPLCNARADHSCLPQGIVSSDGYVPFHKERIEYAKRKSLELSMVDKFNIMTYAFLFLANSCSVKSMALFNKQFTSEEIQEFFAKMAIEALKKEGRLH
jgi:hypothetical protein